MSGFLVDPTMRTYLCLLAVLALLAFSLVAPAAAEPEGPVTPSEPAEPDEAERENVKRFVKELLPDVARIRGLEWKQDVPADLLSRAQLRERMIAMMEEEITPEEKERDIRIMRRFGLIGPDEDPYEMLKDMMENMVAGFYDPEKKRLFLVEGMTGESQKPVVFHELVHALEDQHLGLKQRMEPIKEDSDRVFAEKCLGEGSAEHASGVYMQENPDVARAHRAGQGNPEMMQRQLKVMKKVPAFMIVPTLLHYSVGPAFVKRAVGAAEFPAVMKGLYENPPISQEQVLHSQKWFGELKDYPQKVVWNADFAEIAGEGWEKIHDWSSGELDLAMYLDFFLGYTKGKVNLLLMQQGKNMIPRAKQAAAGWDGGQAYLMEKEGLPAAMIEALIFDTVEDATEAYEAILDALKKSNGDSFSLVEDGEKGSPDRQTSWTGEYGPARIAQRGLQVILVDGVPSERMDAVWEAALATTFEKDVRDTWDPALVADPFVDCDLSDANSGWGVRLPGDDWKVKKAAGRPGHVANATKGAVTVEINVVPAAVDMVKPAVEAQLRMGRIDVDHPTSVTLAGQAAHRYTGPGLVVYLGGVGSRTVILKAQGGDLGDVLDELDQLADRMVLAEE